MLKNNRFLPALAALSTGLFALGAHAQTAPATSTPARLPPGDTVQLSVFEVTTSKDIGYQSTNAAEATRMNTPIENIPMNVTIFNQQFIEDIIATDTSQLLAYDSSSVKTTENDGFLARGSASVGSNFLNGFAQTSGFGSQPLANIERVEIIRGPAAVLYGAGGYGATYNRITKQPRPRQATAGRVIVSDDRSYRAELDYNHGGLLGSGNETLMFRVNGILEDGNTWFGQKKREQAIAPSLLWKIGPRTTVNFEYFYDWRESQASWETPVHAGDPHGMVTGDGAYRITPRRIAWVSPEDYRRNTRQVASYDLRHAFTRDLQFRSQFQYETKHQNQVESFAESVGLTILRDTALMARRWRDLPRTTDNYRTRNELIWNVPTGPIKHRILFGHGWSQQYDMNEDYRSPGNYGGLTGAALVGNGRLTDAQAGSTFNYYPNVTYAQFIANPNLAGYNTNNILPLNLFDRGKEPPLPPIAQRPPLYLNTETKTFQSLTELYVNDVFSFADDRFFVMAGLRYSDVARKTTAWASGTFPFKVRLPAPPTNYQLTDATTSSFGAVWHLNTEKTYTLYANLNSSFNPEFRTNPDGSDLQPEEGNQKEIGLRFSLLKGRISGLVTYFDLLQDNVTQADPAPGRTGYFIQVSGQRSTGYEISVNGRVTDNWLVMGGFSDTDARNDRTGVAKDLSPRFRFTMFNRYNFNSGALKGLNLSLGTIYTSERDLTNATARNEPNWGPLPDWWRVDVIAGYKWKPANSRFSYDFSLKVNNILDNTDIYYVGQWHRYTLDPGREWQAVVGLRF
jgi:outer membrane receptor protein involved in Fe transport